MKNTIALHQQAMRRRAEAVAQNLASGSSKADPLLSPDQVQKALYELRVHQIQLEMQNEELRQTQLTLDTERERYFDLYDLAPVGYCTVSAKGLLLDVNLTAATLLGAPRAALVKQPLSRFIKQSDQDRYFLLSRQLLETGLPQSCELQMLPRDGQPFWAKLIATVTQKDDADVMRIVLTHIGERKRVEQALHDSEQRFRQLFEKNSSVMLLIDPACGKIINANATAVAYYGYPPDKLVGMSINDINMLSPQRISEEMQLAASELRSHFMFQHRLASGEVREVEVHSTPISVGERPELMSIVHDISARMRIARELENLLQEQTAILDSGIVGIVKLQDRKFVWTNAAFAEMLGYTQQELIGQSTRMCYPSEADSLNMQLSAYPVIESGQVFRNEAEFRRRDGTSVWLAISGSQLKSDRQASIWSFVDISERRAADAARQQALALLQQIASRVPGVVYQYRLNADGSSCFPFASEAMRQIYRVSPEEVREDASKVFAVLHPDDLQAVADSIQHSARSLTPWRHEYRVKFADGTVNWLMGNAIPQQDKNGAVLWHGFITDISALKLVEHELRSSEQSLRTSEKQMVIAQQISGTGSWTYNLATDQIWGSAEGLRLFGYPEVAREFPIAEIEARIPERDRVHLALVALIEQGQDYDLEYAIKPADGGAARIVHSVAKLETDRQGKPLMVLGFVQDITKARQMDEQVRQLAFFDPLTALPNRRLLLDRLSQALGAAQRSACYGALMFLDLDNFKPLNDRHGHEAGDLLLVEVARRLNQCVRGMDTVARLGGDEFVVLIGGLTVDRAESTALAGKVAEKIRVALARPYLLTSKTEMAASIEHQCSASIGLVLFSKLDQNQEEILRWADAAMYQAKEAGRNRVRFSDAGLESSQPPTQGALT